MLELLVRVCSVAVLGMSLAVTDVVTGGISRAEAGFSGQTGSQLKDLIENFWAETPYLVNFAENSVDIDGEARRRLDIQAAWIIAHPTVRVRVYGYAPKSGNVAFNMAMALRRAATVARYLNRAGIDGARLEAMISFGEEFTRVDFGGGAAAESLTITTIFALR